MARPKMSTKTRIRRKFTPEYKAEIVLLCRRPGKTVHGVAKEMGLTPSAVTSWVRQAEIDGGGGGAGTLVTAEREELSALRREVKTLRQEREILKRAATFFAKEDSS